MVHKLTLKQTCQSLLHYKITASPCPYTIADYKTTFKKL
jgi:hypothetical protein